jgi:hypothetical protein
MLVPSRPDIRPAAYPPIRKARKSVKNTPRPEVPASNLKADRITPTTTATSPLRIGSVARVAS